MVSSKFITIAGINFQVSIKNSRYSLISAGGTPKHVQHRHAGTWCSPLFQQFPFAMASWWALPSIQIGVYQFGYRMDNITKSNMGNFPLEREHTNLENSKCKQMCRSIPPDCWFSVFACYIFTSACYKISLLYPWYNLLYRDYCFLILTFMPCHVATQDHLESGAGQRKARQSGNACPECNVWFHELMVAKPSTRPWMGWFWATTIY